MILTSSSLCWFWACFLLNQIFFLGTSRKWAKKEAHVISYFLMTFEWHPCKKHAQTQVMHIPYKQPTWEYFTVTEYIVGSFKVILVIG